MEISIQENSHLRNDSNVTFNLWARLSSGDKDAETELLIQYAGLLDTVISQIKRFLPRHVLTDDLRAAGLEGLWQAIRGYSLDKGVPFEAYARLRIRGSVMDELRRMDKHTRVNRQQIKKAQTAYQAQSLPSNFEVSLDEEDRAEWIVDDSVVSPEEAVLRSGEIASLNRALVKLNSQEQLVLALVFTEGLNLSEVAEVLTLSRSRIGQIYDKAIKSLRGSMMNRNRKLK